MVMKVKIMKDTGYMANIPFHLQALQSHPFLAILQRNRDLCGGGVPYGGGD